VVPAHDGSIESLRARRDEIEDHAALGLASEAALDLATSKSRTLALAAELGIRVPRTVGVASERDLVAALVETGLPAVLKPAASWATNGSSGTRLSSVPVQSIDEAKHALEWIFGAGGQALVQTWLPGRREAVSFFHAEGRTWARMAQASHREWPILGGASVLCETIPLLPDIIEPSEWLVQAMDLEGCSMVEYRRDEHGRPVLMEVNPRMGGSVALAIRSGVNFPQLLADWKLGDILYEVGEYRVGQRMRWLPGDIWHLKCSFDSQGQPDVPPRLRATAVFLRDFAKGSTMLDVFERGDMQPGWSEMNKIVVQHAKGRVEGLAPTRMAAERQANGTGAARRPDVDVAIIGAGPYGLGLAAHLGAKRVQYRIFGSPMKTWRDMPQGMNLKSLGFATSIPTPDGSRTFPEYCRASGLEDYEPIEFATFARYGMTFQRELVPTVEETVVTNLSRADGQFSLTLATGEQLRVRQVVVAVGLTYFARTPDTFVGLPASHLAHTWGHMDFPSYAGKDVVVIGGGSSALETATLVHEHGGKVEVLARGDVHWSGQVPREWERPWIERLKMPPSSLGHGRENWVLQHVPGLMHHLPAEKRIPFTRRHLGPAPAWWLRDRAEGKFPIRQRTIVQHAALDGDAVHLQVRRADGGVEDLWADQVITGTGYVFELDRLTFLDRGLLGVIDRHELAPKLTRQFESSVPGLYFVGPIAAESFGPLVRFVAGAPYAVAKAAGPLSRTAKVSS
jgi:predicted ATP-grasp superfamily ATP-dependent carboligase